VDLAAGLWPAGAAPPGVEPTAGEAGVDDFVHEQTGIVFVWVPPGSFDMGSEDGLAVGRPVRRVTFARGFWLAKHPVTWGQHRAFCGATGVAEPEERGEGGGIEVA
jgi:formylglycine-generating enzyme required for sulfatase activity